MLVKLSALVAVMSVSLIAVSPASALERGEATREVIRVPSVYTSPAEMKSAYIRLKSAARRACDSGLTRDLQARASDRACAAAALDEAVRASNLPELIAYHEGKTAGVPIYADNTNRVTTQR